MARSRIVAFVVTMVVTIALAGGAASLAIGGGAYGLTLFVGVPRSAYQHGLFPAWYWRLWCDHVASRGHLHVLRLLAEAAEGTRPGSKRASGPSSSSTF